MKPAIPSGQTVQLVVGAHADVESKYTPAEHFQDDRTAYADAKAAIVRNMVRRAEEGHSDLLSPLSPEVIARVSTVLHLIGEVVVLHRFTRSAGRRDWHIVRSLPAFYRMIEVGKPADSYTFFLTPQFPLRGQIDEDFATHFIELLNTVEVPKTEVVLGEVEEHTSLIRDAEGWSPQEIGEARMWLADHWGRAAAAGLHPNLFASDNEVRTTFVPNEEGLIVRGVY